MTRKPIVILPLAAALASLAGLSKATAATPDVSNDADPEANSKAANRAAELKPNFLFKAGEDLLGLIVTKAADGTLLAQHYSHYSHSSHSSHSSHHSHYSSRY